MDEIQQKKSPFSCQVGPRSVWLALKKKTCLRFTVVQNLTARWLKDWWQEWSPINLNYNYSNRINTDKHV